MATNFLEATGTNGFIATITVSLVISNLGSGSAVTCTNVFTPGSGGSLAGAQKCQAYFTSMSIPFIPAAGGLLACWWLLSNDNGTTFETLLATPSATQPALPRPPDFIIPVYEGGTSITANAIKWANGPFRYPYVAAKVVIQNLSGVALGSGTTASLVIGGVADQY